LEETALAPLRSIGVEQVTAGDRAAVPATGGDRSGDRQRPESDPRRPRSDRRGDHRRRALWHLGSAMSTDEMDVRCSACGKLLAKARDGSLVIQRGDLRATFDGQFRASLTCSRPGCGQTNVIVVVSQRDCRVAFSR